MAVRLWHERDPRPNAWTGRNRTLLSSVVSCCDYIRPAFPVQRFLELTLTSQCRAQSEKTYRARVRFQPLRRVTVAVAHRPAARRKSASGLNGNLSNVGM